MGIGAIKSVADAINLINSGDFQNFIRIDRSKFPFLPVYNKPFGIWFRGQADNWDLLPTVFRDGHSYDETSMYYHFQSRAGHRDQCLNTFDWLCLMRHFELPVRILDWSENLLIALFFASSDPDTTDGILHVLNALKLNACYRSKIIENVSNKGIAAPFSVDTAVRAEMSRARSIEDLVDLLSSFNRNYAEDFKSLNKIRDELEKKPGCVLKQFNTPIAVLPHRFDTRIILQQSAFTIHGGKLYNEEGGTRIESAKRLSETAPESLGSLNKVLSSDEKFLYSITVTNKEKIRKELNYLGIHEGSLFPELDRQSDYIKKKWSY